MTSRMKTKTCEVYLCDEPRRLPDVTWNGVALCREHWRSALVGGDVQVLASMKRVQSSIHATMEAYESLGRSMGRYIEASGGSIDLVGDLDE